MFGSPKRQASEADAILVWASPTRQERARLIKRVTPKFAWLDSEVWEKEWWCSVFWEDEPYIWLVETNQMTKGNYSGYFPWVHFLFIVSFLTDSVVVVWCFSTNSGPGDHITPSREVGYKKGVTHCLTFIACSLPWNTEEWLIWKTSRLVDGCWLKCNGAPCFLQNALSPTTSGGMACVRSNCYRNVPWQDGRKYSAMTGNGIKWSGETGIAGQAIVTTAIDSWTTDCPLVILMYCFFIKWSSEFIVILFMFIQIGIMEEMCHEPINLDKLINEGIAFSIKQF